MVHASRQFDLCTAFDVRRPTWWWTKPARSTDSNPEFKQELEKCHSKLGGWPTDADFDFVYTFSYDTGSDRLVGFSCRHEGVTPFIPADAYDNCNKHDDC